MPGSEESNEEREATVAEDAAVVDAVEETDEEAGAVVGDQVESGAAFVGGWGYLGLLFAVFLVLALVAYGCDDGSGSDGGGQTPVTADNGGDVSEVSVPVDLLFVVDSDTITLQGAVPDEMARDQLVELAEARYADGNVVDELTIDPALVLEDGVISISGATTVGDDRPEGLLADVQAAMGLTAGTFDVEFAEVEPTAMEIDAQVAPDGIGLTGSVPDEATFNALVSSAEALWGAGSVDSSGLVPDPNTTLSGGSVTLGGTADAGDRRVAAFVAGLEDLGLTATNEVEFDTSADALARLEETLRTELAADPILFALGSSEIDPASDGTLQTVAASITAAPDIGVEIVGHTDSTGDSDSNQVLSGERANAVLDRLVELGVDENRLSARGAGDTEPIADNETEEGRAANRRIAFEFEGAADQPDPEQTDPDQ